jgi:hypothetical protein
VNTRFARSGLLASAAFAISSLSVSVNFFQSSAVFWRLVESPLRFDQGLHLVDFGGWR